MWLKTIKSLFLILAPVVSGVLLVLAFPIHDLWGLAWVALIPLLIAMHGRHPLMGFALSFIFGFVAVIAIFNWIFEVRGYTIFHHICIASYLATIFGMFGWAYTFTGRRLGSTQAFWAAPFLWVSMEFIRSNLSFLALPWAWIAHTQHHNILMIQIASLTGTYSISFLIVMANATVAAILLSIFQAQPAAFFADRHQLKKTAIAMTVVTIVAVAGVMIYGQISLKKTMGDRSIKVAVIQGNISQKAKWDPKFADFIMKRYTDLSIQASKDNPDIIVWPEGATPGFVLKRGALYKQIVALAKQINTPLLIGSSEYPKFETNALSIESYGNTALFFSEKGKVLGQYLKIILVPFTEKIPYEGIIPWPQFILPDKNASFEIPGKEIKVFEINGARFATPICWETHFPGLIRRFVKQGANFMLNIVNEGRYGDSAAPFQLLAMTVFRAVENRVPVARATNTGISCFIDSFGRVSRPVEKDGKILFVEGYLTKNISIAHKKSFYTLYGYLFVYVNLIIALLVLVASFTKRPKKS